MANFSYKKTITTKMKVCGLLDVGKMTIDVDDEERSLAALIADFDGADVEIQIGVKDDIELDPPKESRRDNDDE